MPRGAARFGGQRDVDRRAGAREQLSREERPGLVEALRRGVQAGQARGAPRMHGRSDPRARSVEDERQVHHVVAEESGGATRVHPVSGEQDHSAALCHGCRIRPRPRDDLRATRKRGEDGAYRRGGEIVRGLQDE
ncbi:dihydropteroate synthase [Microbacterium testaceum StLB037]|uniref:Dihydropteroate synthase n=1 Tax=Microbacterium testaceum (strain StLB037) TaxID=979556 RepID=E8NC45_MICTS|nr:dihydropteroate synthase [Microbacterium testaceum StLB037]